MRYLVDNKGRALELNEIVVKSINNQKLTYDITSCENVINFLTFILTKRFNFFLFKQ